MIDAARSDHRDGDVLTVAEAARIAGRSVRTLRRAYLAGVRRAERHLRIRARSAPGQVAGAASYTSGLTAHRNGRPARPRSPRAPVPERREPTTPLGRSQRLRQHSHAGTPRYGT